MKRNAGGELLFADAGKVSAEDVNRIVDALGVEPSDNLDICSAAAVGVTVLQVLFKIYNNLEEYISDMNSYILDAVNRRAQIVVFPGFAGLLPISTSSMLRVHMPRLILPESNQTKAALRAGGAKIDVHALRDALVHLCDYTFDAYFYTMSALAARHRVYIMAGSTLCFENDELCHRAFLFSDEGEIAGYQDKISEGPLELALEIPPES